MQYAALPLSQQSCSLPWFPSRKKSLFFKIGLWGVGPCTLDPLCRCSAGDGKVTEQPLVLVVLPNSRAGSISVLQEQLLFEGKKMTLGLADARGVPGGKASRWCSRMEPRRDAPECHRVSGTRSQPPCALPESHGRNPWKFPKSG